MERANNRLLASQGPQAKQLVVPSTLQTDILFYYHGLPLTGHLGQNKVIPLIRTHFYWEGMNGNIRQHIKKCMPCKKRKTPRPLRAGLTETFSPTGPFHTIGMDLCGPYLPSKQNNTYILGMICLFLRWPMAVALPDKTSYHITAAVIKELITKHGCPVQLLTDNERTITSQTIKQLCRHLGIKKIHTTTHNPTGNATCERFFRYMNAALTLLVGKYKKNWETCLDIVLFAYRISVQAITGLTPFFALYGRRARLPLGMFFDQNNLYQNINEYTENFGKLFTQIYAQIRARQNRLATARQKKRDERQRRYSIGYQPGDRVLLYDPNRAMDKLKELTKFNTFSEEEREKARSKLKKLSYQWTGPWEIVDKVHNNLYRLRDIRSRKEETHSANKLYLYNEWGEDVMSEVEPFRINAGEKGKEGEEDEDEEEDIQVKKGDLIVITIQDIDEPFRVGKVLKIKDDESMILHWYGQHPRNLMGTWKPGWIDPKDNKIRYSMTPMGKPYTHYDYDLYTRQAICAGFELKKNNKLSKDLYQVLSNHRDVQWELPTNLNTLLDNYTITLGVDK